MLAESLISLAVRDEFGGLIRAHLLRLVSQVDKSNPVDEEELGLSGEVAVLIARRLDWPEILEVGATSPVIAVRAASVRALYYIWRHDPEKGVMAMKHIAMLAKDEISRSVFALGVQFFRNRLLRKTDASQNVNRSLALTSSFFGLTMMMVSHCLREPETVRDLNQAWHPIFQALNRVPRPLRRLIEIFFQRDIQGLLQRIWGEPAVEEPEDRQVRHQAYAEINVRTFAGFR